MTYLLFIYILAYLSSSVPLNSHLTIFRGKVSFFSKETHTLLPAAFLATLTVRSAPTKAVGLLAWFPSYW